MRMKIKKRKKSMLIFTIITLFTLLFLCGCGSKNNDSLNRDTREHYRLDNVDDQKQRDEASRNGAQNILPNKAEPSISANQTPASKPPAAPQTTVTKPDKPKIKKVAYLTFDDGPSNNVTPQMLDTLKKYDIKATFFIIGKNTVGNEGVVRRIKSEGHIIGNHSYTHDDKRLYSDFEYFKSDFNQCNETLTKLLGEGGYSKIYRFPRGEYGHHKKERAFVEGKGFKVYDWNCLSYDAELPENKTPQQLLENIKATSRGKNNLIVLMHTSANRQNSADALPSIIEYLKSQEYSFDVL